MMILHILSESDAQINEIADLLLTEGLLSHAMFSDAMTVKSVSEDGSIAESNQFRLQGISKSLLFPVINNRLKDKYQDDMPLLYSEPIILIDPIHQNGILESLSKV